MNRSGATMILHSGSAYHSKAKSMRMICTADARWSYPRVRLCSSKPEIYTTTEQHIHNSHHTVAHSSFCTYSFITAALEYSQLTDPPPPSGFPKAFTRPFHIPPTIFNFAAPDLHLLEGEMKRLFLLGYRWSHTYTQCVLQSALQSIKNKSEFDISECNAQLDQDLEGALNAIEGDEMEHIDPQNLAIVRFTPSVADPHSDFADEFYYPPMEEILPAARNNGAGETEKGGDAEEHKSENDKSNVITAQLENESGKDHSSDSNKAYGNPSVLSSMGDDRKAALHDMARNMNHELAFVPPEPLPYDDEEEEPVMNRQDIINDRLSLPPPALPMSLYFDENDNGLSPYDVSRKHYDYDLLFQSPYSTPPRVSPMYKRSERPLGTFENGRTDLEGFFRKLLRRSALQSENLRKLARMLTDLGSTESSKGASPLDYSASPNYFPPSGIEEFRNYNDRGFNNFQEPPQNSQYQGEGRPEDQISYYSPYGVGYPPGPYSRNEPEIPILEPPADEAEEALLDALDPPYIKSDYDKPEEPSDTSVARFDKNANPIYDPYEQPIDVQDSYQWVVPNNVPSENSYASPQRGVPPTLSEEITYGRPYLAYNYPAYDYRDYPDYYDYGGDYGNPSGPTPWNFHRDERYDVKKPGPFFKSKNDFAFDYPDGDAPPNDYDPGENNWIAKMDPLEGEAVLLTKLRQSQGLNKDGTKMYHGKELKELQMDQFPDLLLTDEGYVQDSGSKVRGIGPHGFPKASHQVALQNSDGKEGEAQPKEPDSYVYISISEDFPSVKQAEQMVNLILDQSGPPKIHMSQIQNLSVEKNQVRFQVKDGTHGETAAHLAEKTEELRDAIMEKTGMEITQAGVGTKRAISAVVYSSGNHQMLAVAAIVCGVCAALLVAATTLFFLRRHSRSKSKLQGITAHDTEASKDYQDLCRARMAGKGDGKDPLASGPGHAQPVGSAQSGHVPGQRISSLSKESDNGNNSPSSRSSTSSWNEEPVISNMDISTGHMVLSYMEDHLRNKDRLDQEWVALCAYEAEPCACHVALKPENLQKNRYQDAVPYDHNRVILNEHTNVSGSNYINASSITDHDPRNPAYIVTQGPLAATAADFWQLVWEQGSVVIVMLTRLTENGQALCHRYWPEEGSELYHIYEVHLVSEHIWCDDYLVRSFYLKNVRTGETRTVSQFHFLSWPESGIPASTKALLGFRRKVNKSYRGSSCPIIVNCSDGVGRSGTYCLIDMVLNRMSKGAKEIDIAATLEHIRDQRPNMVKTKAQFEFVLMSVAEEVHAILKALPQ